MKLIFGLGNIGPHFDGTRHNVGFMACNALAAHNQAEWLQKDKLKATIAAYTVKNEKILLAKPNTYYNLAGEAAAAIQAFYKIDTADILIIHDELAIPFGTIRARVGGSDAGNNGVKSIAAHLGPTVARIRIGIANKHTPTHDAADFVLGQFSHQERTILPRVIHTANLCVHDFIQNERLEHRTVFESGQEIKG